MAEPTPPRMTTIVAITVLAAAVIGVAMVAAPWTGPILVTVVPNHGLEVPDLVPFALAGIALALLRRRFASTPPADQSLCGPAVRPVVLVVSVSLAGAGALRLADLDRDPSRLPYGLFTVVVLGLGTLVACWLRGGGGLRTADRGPASMRSDTGGVVPRHRTMPAVLVLVLVLAIGTVIDLMVLPSGTVFGAALLAIALAAKGDRPWGLRLVLIILGAAGLALSFASLADLAGVDVLMARDGGGAARGVLLGAIAAAVVVPGVFHRTNERGTGATGA